MRERGRSTGNSWKRRADLYGPNYPAMNRLAAEYVDKILKSPVPADLRSSSRPNSSR